MILIISLAGDLSTNEVIEWLRLYNKDVIRINGEDRVHIEKINFNTLQPEAYFRINNGDLFCTRDITAFWYRRGDILLQGRHGNEIEIREDDLKSLVSSSLSDEAKDIRDLLYYITEKKTISFGSFSTKDNNKLIHLQEAKKRGILIPETIVCSSKNELLTFIQTSPNGIITKPITNGTFYVKKRKNKQPRYFVQFANEIGLDDLSQFSDRFFPTLLQQRIDKKFELRIFYLQGTFNSMAIFSQKDEKTKIDFRRYNREKQNYRVPFELPIVQKRKLKRFMKAVGLQTGSIDMLYSTDDQYYFLEVNPVGQFGMISYPCNLKLEKQIAIALSGGKKEFYNKNNYDDILQVQQKRKNAPLYSVPKI